jgi:hypothetical protein
MGSKTQIVIAEKWQREYSAVHKALLAETHFMSRRTLHEETQGMC